MIKVSVFNFYCKILNLDHVYGDFQVSITIHFLAMNKDLVSIARF